MTLPLRPLLIAAVSLCAASSPAADILKSGSGTDLVDGANWSGGVAPGSSDVATWDSSSLASGLTLGTNVTWQGVRISGSSGSGTVSLSGAGAINLGGSGINLEGSAVSATFSNALSLAADQSWLVNAGRTLTLSGPIVGSSAVSIGSAPARTSSLFLTSSLQTIATGMTLSDVTGISGLLGGNFINSQRTVAAHGYLVSSASTSQVYWLQGIDGSVKAVKVELVQAGADIQARVLAAKYGDVSPGFDFETGGTTMASLAESYNAAGYGAFSLGLHMGSAPVNQAGQVTLSGSNSFFSGNLTVNRGRLVFGSGSAFDGGGSPSRGAGTLTIGPGGVVSSTAAHAIWGGHTNTRSVILNGGVVDISGGQEYFHTLEMTAGLVTRGNGGSTNLFRVGSASGAGQITTNASPASAILHAAVDLTFNSLSLSVADGAAANDLVIAGAITQNTGAGSGAKSVTKSGSGTVLLQGASSFTGGMIVNAGTVRVGNLSALGTRNTAVGTVTIASGATVDLNGTADATYGYTVSGSGVGGLGALVNNGAGITTATAQTTNLRLAANATIGGTGEWGMLGSGFGDTSIDLATFTLTKVGSGSFHLANTTFTAGTLSIQQGVIFLNANAVNTRTSASAVAVSLANAAGTALELNGKSLVIGSLSGGGASGGNVTLGSGTLTVGDANSTTYAGLISGAGAVVKQGGGTLTLTGSNTFAGGLTVNAGTLRLATAGGAWNTSVFGSLATVNSGGRLQVNGGWNTGSGATITVNSGGALEYVDAYAVGGANTTYIGTVNLAGSAGSAATVEGVGAPRFGFNANGLINSTGAVTNTWSAGIQLVNGSSRTMTIATGDGNTLAISGVIHELTGYAGTPLTKSGAGTLRLSGANSFTGALTLSAGTLEVSGAGSLGNGSYAAAIQNDGVLAIGMTQNQTLSGVISGAGSLAKSGAGTLTLSGASANTFTGGSTLSAGTVAIGKAGALGTGTVTLAGATLQPTATVAVANNLVFQSGTTSSLIGAGAGDLMYTGAASGSGAVTLNSSVSRSTWLQGDWSAFTGTLSITVNTGGTNYRLGGTPGSTTANDGTNGSDFSQARIVLAGGGTDRGLLWNGQAGATVKIGELSGTGGRIDLNRAANWSVGHLGTDSTFSGLILGTGNALTKVGAGTLTLSGANTFTGGMVVNAGTVRLGNTSALGTRNTAVGTVTIAAGATVDLNGTVDATYGYTLSGSGVGGLGALVNNGATIGTGIAQTTNLRLAANATIGGTGEWGMVGAGFAATSVDLAGHTLTKVGAGGFHLANTTFTAGNFDIQQGAVFINLSSTSVDASAVALSLANAAGASLGLNGKSLTLASLAGGGATGGNVSLGAGTLAVGNANSTAYAGVISGTGGLVKQGAGTLTLSGANTFTGPTSVTAGTLELTGAALAGNASVSASASLRFSYGSSGVVYGGQLSGTGNVVVSGASNDLQLSGNNAGFTGTVTVSDGAQLRLRNDNAVSGAALTLQSGGAVSVFNYVGNAAFTVGSLASDDPTTWVRLGSEGNRGLTVGGNNQSTTFAGVIKNDVGGIGFLTKVGTGTLTLTGANTYSGATTISAGTLAFASGSLGTTGAITLAGGGLRWVSGNTQDISSRLAITASATLDTNGNDVTLGSALSGASSLTLTKSGSGILTLGAANSGLASPWVVAAGTLRAGHAQAFGTGSIRVEGGVLDLNGLSVANVFTLAGGSVTGFASLSAAQLDLSSTSAPKLSGVISGTLNLAGKAVDATGGLTATGTLKGAGATFSGGTVTLGANAVHAPGDSPGTQTFEDGLAYGATSTLQWEIELEPLNWTGEGPQPGDGFDFIAVTGGSLDIAAGAKLEIQLVDDLGTAGFSDSFWDEFRSFQAISYTSIDASITGIFTLDAAAANLVAAGRGSWDILHDASGVSLTWTPVPEPSTYGLILGGVALAGAAWRRGRARRR